jgi:hypothetical protein
LDQDIVLQYHLEPMARKTKRNRSKKSKKAGVKPQPPTYGVPMRRANTRIVKRKPDNRFVEAVCSNIDPFCPAADGAKQFGGGASNKSVPVRCIGLGYVTTTGGGEAITRIQPNLVYTMQDASSITSHAAAGWSTAVPMSAYSELSTYDGQYRIVSFGVHVFSTTAATASQGAVSLVTTAGPDDTLNVGNTMHLDTQRTSLAGLDAYWIAKPADLSQDFVDIASTVKTGWSNLYIVVSAAATSTVVIGYEVIMNIEWYPTLPGILSSVSTPMWSSKPRVESTVDKTRGMMGYVYDHLPNKDVVKTIMNVAGTAATFYNPALGASVNAARTGVSMIMDVD